MSDHEPISAPDTGPEPDGVSFLDAAEPEPEPLPTPAGGRRRRRGPRGSGCLPVLAILAVVVVLGLVFVPRAIDSLKGALDGGGDDFAGPGTGTVSFQVHQGDSITVMGQNLQDAGVVASVEAFTDAAGENAKATGIQAGFYDLKKQMKAADVVKILVDPKKIVSTAVTVREGLRASAIVDLLAEKTKLPRKGFLRVLNNPGPLGLPSYADGNAEGYLFPATYSFPPDATPTSILTTMVARWKQSADAADLEGSATALGYTPGQLMTVASLVQAEGRGDDMAKVARVIYNRLENPGTAGTTGKLEIDATVAYALGENPGVALSAADLAVDSPYNTRLVAGLPPGPIDSPGDAAIDAAAHPTKGDWYYYVTVNLRTGETKFASTPEEFQQFKNEYLTYCQTSDAC